MNKVLFLALVAFTALISLADLGSGGHPADAYSRDEIAFARRGALGADSYVVTNVFTQMPCYALATGVTTSLVDRAVNSCSVTTDVTFVAPPIPTKRSVDPYRCARAFLLVINAPTNEVPEISFVGFGRLYTLDGGALDIGKGKTLLSFIEITDGDFLVESREISSIN